MSRGNRIKKPFVKRLGPNNRPGNEGNSRREKKEHNPSRQPIVGSLLTGRDAHEGESHEQPKKPQDISETHSKFWLRDPDPIVRLTGWIAVFTFCLLAVGFIQVWAYIQRERAVISVNDIKLSTGKFIANSEFYFSIPLRNTGGVAATPVSSFVGTRTDQLPAHEKYLVGQVNLPKFIVPSGREVEQRYWLPKIKGQNVKLDEDQVSQLDNGQVRFFIYGQFRYVDSFSFWPFKPKTIQFCFEYIGGRDATFVMCRETTSAQ